MFRSRCARAMLFGLAGFFASSAPAMASTLIYTPINPAFGGNPLNANALLSAANAQNGYKAPVTGTTNSQAAQFLRILQGQLMGAVASQITSLIFGQSQQTSGTIKFGDQTISYVRGADSVELTVTNAVDGSITQIIVPILAGSGD